MSCEFVDRFTVVAYNLKDGDADSPRWITHGSFGGGFLARAHSLLNSIQGAASLPLATFLTRLRRFQSKTRIRDRNKIFAVGEPIVLAMPKP
jgi:hypothetical protein